MSEPVSHTELTRIILDIAKRGHIDVAAITSNEDLVWARKFSSYFREAVRGVSDDAALRAVKAVAAKGARKFRSGCGQWLTDKEFAA